jgi:DNA-binding CsgD family transcriptional regulator
VSCLQTVALGRIWMEDCIFHDSKRVDHSNALTNREREVLERVQQGRSNRDIAKALDIQPGTVEIHLRHIFEKTGIRGRHALALATYSDSAETNAANIRGLPTYSVAAA